MSTHHLSGTRIYQAWQNMKSRCMKPSNNRYHRYGGRGIKVCERWLSFENFYEDMGDCGDLTLDRIGNNGHYEPDNCQWVPMSDQGKKTSRIRYLTYNGETFSLSEWARRIGVRGSTLSMRLNAYGWSIDRALSNGGVL